MIDNPFLLLLLHSADTEMISGDICICTVQKPKIFLSYI